MTDPERVAMLTEALALVAAVNVTWDDNSRKTCGDCGVVAYHNWFDRKYGAMTKAAQSKITEVIRNLERRARGELPTKQADPR